jgi:hypothetical protein
MNPSTPVPGDDKMLGQIVREGIAKTHRRDGHPMMDARVGESMWRFRQNVNALVGHEVTVRSVLPAPSQWRGKLMRVAPEGQFHETDLDGRSWEWQRVLCSVDPVGHRT